MPHPHQIATLWPEIFGVLALIANFALAISIKRDPRVQLPLTLTAVAITALAASILFTSPKSVRSNSANTVFYPAADPPARVPAPLRYRKL